MCVRRYSAEPPSQVLGWFKENGKVERTLGKPIFLDFLNKDEVLWVIKIDEESWWRIKVKNLRLIVGITIEPPLDNEVVKAIDKVDPKE